MKRIGYLVLVATLAAPGLVLAQEKPSFSGTWTLDASKSHAPARAGRAGQAGRASGKGRASAMLGGSSGPVVITQSDTQITVGGVTYKLDGSTSPIGKGKAASATAATAKWDGAKLVIQTTRDRQGKTVTTKEVRSLDSTGKEMTVEISIATPRGEQTAKQVFTKS
jgi:hypothetical protein